MCLAIPLKIKKIEGDFAEVEAGSFRRKVNIQMLPNTKVGDFVLVHAGFAIQKIDTHKAEETLRMIDEVR
ncbi:MAG: HypC/HybG/HupF family hydrogenase formation chaperone [Candidatus Omnitrophota bacterium]